MSGSTPSPLQPPGAVDDAEVEKPGHALHLALDTTVLWNRFYAADLSVVCHSRAIQFIWQTLEHPSASVGAEVVIALPQRSNRFLSESVAITVMADRPFNSGKLLAWFDGKARWRNVMQHRANTWIHNTAVPMGCEVRRLHLLCGQCRVPGCAALGWRTPGKSGRPDKLATQPLSPGTC
jgi:hypothetical protein